MEMPHPARRQHCAPLSCPGDLPGTQRCARRRSSCSGLQPRPKLPDNPSAPRTAAPWGHHLAVATLNTDVSTRVTMLLTSEPSTVSRALALLLKGSSSFSNQCHPLVKTQLQHGCPGPSSLTPRRDCPNVPHTVCLLFPTPACLCIPAGTGFVGLGSPVSNTYK